MPFKHLMLALLFLFSLLALGQTDSRPIMVIELMRHGARAAYAPIWDTTKAWAGRYGELTNAGMRMHYLLGGFVAQNYSDLLGTYDPSQISVYSTDVNRTIMSAYSHLYGMFPPGKTSPLTDYQNKTALPPGLEYSNLSAFVKDNYSLPNAIQPVPVHIVDRSRDYYLAAGDSCKNWSNISQAAAASSPAYVEFQTMMKNTTAFIEASAKLYNVTLTDNWSYQSLTDLLIANYYENLTFPVNITVDSKQWDDLMYYNNWFVTFMYTGTENALKLQSVNLFDRMFSQLNGKLNGTFDKKFALHSAHDTTLIPMLAVLGLMNATCLKDVYLGNLPEDECKFPEYSANIITELYNDTAKPYIKLKYNGEYKNICNTADFTCDLGAYKQLVNTKLQGYNSTNFLQDCGMAGEVIPNPPGPNPTNDDPNSQRTTLMVLVIVLGIVCLIELGVLVMFLLKRGKGATITKLPNDQSLISHP